jgi:hypothetical protein
MKLIDTWDQPSIGGFPAFHHELWDLGDGYKIYVAIGSDSCSLGVHAPGDKIITYELAGLLGVDTDLEKLVKDREEQELCLSLGIYCVVLNYSHPENYRAFRKN